MIPILVGGHLPLGAHLDHMLGIEFDERFRREEAQIHAKHGSETAHDRYGMRQTKVLQMRRVRVFFRLEHNTRRCRKHVNIVFRFFAVVVGEIDTTVGQCLVHVIGRLLVVLLVFIGRIVNVQIIVQSATNTLVVSFACRRRCEQLRLGLDHESTQQSGAQTSRFEHARVLYAVEAVILAHVEDLVGCELEIETRGEHLVVVGDLVD